MFATEDCTGKSMFATKDCTGKSMFATVGLQGEKKYVCNNSLQGNIKNMSVKEIKICWEGKNQIQTQNVEFKMSLETVKGKGTLGKRMKE